MSYFAYPDANNQTFAHLLQWTNIVTDGYFGIAILFMVFLVSYISLKSVGWQNDKVLPFVAFITMIVSAFLVIIGITNQSTMVLCIVIFVVSLWIVRND